MALGVKYLFRWQDRHGAEWKVEILQDGYTGAAKTRAIGGQSVTLRRDNNGGIWGTSLELSAECSVDGEYADLYTSNPFEFQVRLKCGTAILWKGYVSPELYSEPFIAPPYDVRITASDNLGELKNYKWSPVGRQSLHVMLGTLLNATGMGYDIQYISSVRAGSLTAAQFYSNVTVDWDELTDVTFYDVLDKLMQTFHAVIFQHGLSWIVMRETDVTPALSGGKVFPAGSSAGIPVASVGSAYAGGWWPEGHADLTIVPARKNVTINCEELWDRTGDATVSNPTTGNATALLDVSFDAADGINLDETNREDAFPLCVNVELGWVLSYLRSKRSYFSLVVSVTGNGITRYLVSNDDDSGVEYKWSASRGSIRITPPANPVSYAARRTSAGTSYPTSGEVFTLQLPQCDGLTALTRVRVQATSNSQPSSGRPTQYYPTVHFFDAWLSYGDTYAALSDVIEIDNNARQPADNVNMLISGVTSTAEAKYFIANTLKDRSGVVVGTVESDLFTGYDYLSFIARDYALSVAAPRLKAEGTLNGVASPVVTPLFMAMGGHNFIIQEWSWDLIEGSLNMSALTLPVVSIEVSSETIIAGNAVISGPGSSGTGSSSGGSGTAVVPPIYPSTEGYIGTTRIQPAAGEQRLTGIADISMSGDLNIAGSINIGGVGVLQVVNIGTESEPVYVLRSTLGFYSDSFVSAFGASDTGGGGGGLIQKVYGTSGFGGTYSDTDYTNTFNAFAINRLHERITALEGASVDISVKVTGSGNAVTTGSYSNGQITLTKGATFLTEITSAMVVDALGFTPISANALTDYLPLNLGAGQTLTGNSSTQRPLTIVRNLASATAYVAIGFASSTTDLGAIGMNAVGQGFIRNGSDSTYYTIFTSGNANLATVDWVARNLTAAGTLSVTGASTLANVTANSITLGDGVLTWDSENSAWKLTGNLYATGFISAFGASDTSGGGGIDLPAMWANLQINESGTTGYGLQIDYHHLPTIRYSGTGFVTAAAWSKDSQTNKNYLTFTRRALTASDIPSLTTAKISDLETWISGKGYASASSLANYLPLAGGTMEADAAISWGNNDRTDWASTPPVGLRIMSSTAADSGAPTRYATGISIRGRYRFQLASRGGANELYYKSGDGDWLQLYHTENLTKSVVTGLIGSDVYLPLSGGTMTGTIRREDWDNATMLYRNVTGTASSSWSRNFIVGVVDGVTTGGFRIGYYGASYTAGASDNGITYAFLGMDGYAGLNLRIAKDSLKWGSDEIWHAGNANLSSVNWVAKDLTAAGTLSVTGATTLADLTVGSSNSITLGDGVLTWDSTNSAWKLTGNLYATGFISAFGASDGGGGGGGINLAAMWANLQINESGTTGYNLQIHPAHLTTALSGYVNAVSTTGSGNAVTAVSQSGSTITFTKGSTFALASRTITGTGYLTGGGSLAADRTIDIASTYKGYIDEGHTAHGWGNHASAGYLTSATAANTYLPLTGGTLTGVTTVKYTSQEAFAVNRSNNNIVSIGFYGRVDGVDDTALGRIGYNTAGAWVRDASDTDYRYIWHTGNLTSSAVTGILASGSIANGKLANSSITINGTSTSLGGTFNTASITAGTAGTSSATSGLSFAVPYVTLNAYGVATAYGTHTHTISASDITTAIGSTTYAPYNAAGYLPLSGGTMTGSPVLSNAVYLRANNAAGTDLNILGISASDNLLVGYGIAGQGYETHLYGGSTVFHYGTARAVGMTLTSGGNVGIGVAAPTIKLQVAGAVTATGAAMFQTLTLTSTAAANHINFSRAGANYINVPTGGTFMFSVGGYGSANTMLRVSASGVAVNTAISETDTLAVGGTIYASTGIYSDGYVSAFGVSSTSDERFKRDFIDTSLSVADIAHAPAITFLWKDREGRRQAGSLAQYWETVLPEVVSEHDGKKALDYGAAALVSAITIARDVNDHERRIHELERENRELKRRLGYAD